MTISFKISAYILLTVNCTEGFKSPIFIFIQSKSLHRHPKTFHMKTSNVAECTSTSHRSMNEWMMHLYSALLCIAVHPKFFTVMRGVSPQPPPVCSIHLDEATAATAQRRQCAHHTPATGGEERVIEPIKWMGIIRRPWWSEAGIWPGHRGYTPTLYDECHGIFNDHRESGPRFNVSSKRRCFLTV